MIQNDTTSVKRKKGAGFGRRIQQSLKIDMTPMVDLGFLLITFFVITTELSRPTSMDLYMPKDGPDTHIGDSYALSIILSGEKNFYYEGEWNRAVIDKRVFPVTTAQLRRIIIQKQQHLDRKNIYKVGREGLMMLIKPTERASYKEIVDLLDEATINQVKKYAVIKVTVEEKNWIKENL
jgi:biopolymer transport protein ExbD